MKEKYIFIGIVIVAIIAVGVVGYRSMYRSTDQAPYAAQQETGALQGETPTQPGGYTAPTSQPSVTPPTTPPGVPSTAVPAAPATVQYNESGFSPAPLVVKVGRMVTFKNEGSADMWVASAPHPTHTDYPGFDALRPYKPGESYSFTFTRVGTWKYHNHLNPKHYGSIVVTE